MRILCFSGCFPPQQVAEAHQAGLFLRALSQLGHEVKVITQKSDASLERNETFDVQEVGIKEGWERWVPFLRLKNAAVGWAFAACERGRELLRQSNFDFIYSRSSPYGSHLAAGWLAHKHGLPWIAHFSDPWYGMPYHQYSDSIRPGVEQIFEFFAMRWAWAITWTNEAARDLYATRYPGRQKSFM
jgi:hypothetical protein